MDFAGTTIVEDCYNASPDSMVAAINTLAGYPTRGRRILVLSDMLELGEISRKSHLDMGKFAARAGIDMLFATGPQSIGYIEGAESEGMERCLNYPDRESLAQAVRTAIRPGDVAWFKGSRGMELEKALDLLYGRDTPAEH
jgi:UDP-N-acetylmuramoyl-tripeptide--D-alanyl-D-alanine ligase